MAKEGADCSIQDQTNSRLVDKRITFVSISQLRLRLRLMLRARLRLMLRRYGKVILLSSSSLLTPGDPSFPFVAKIDCRMNAVHCTYTIFHHVNGPAEGQLRRPFIRRNTVGNFAVAVLASAGDHRHGFQGSNCNKVIMHCSVHNFHFAILTTLWSRKYGINTISFSDC